MQPLKHTEGHSLIVGTTGSGKTRMFDILISQAILRGEAVIIIDPKGDKEMRTMHDVPVKLWGSRKDSSHFIQHSRKSRCVSTLCVTSPA